MPLVSVIIPTYNYCFYILEAINSVLEQNFPSTDIEIIVVDDGSTDDTQNVLKSLISNNTIKYFYQNNKGKANATNKAIEKCTGKYIFNLDADDYFLPDKIASTIKIFETDEAIVHVATPAQVLNQETKKSEAEKIPADLLEKPLDGIWLLKRFYNNNMLFGGGTTFAAKSDILKKINIPDEVDMYIDEFLILAVLPYGKSYFLKEPLSIWRVHTSNYSGNHSTGDVRLKKARRLEDSSAAVLGYLQSNNFDNELIKIYRLQDATRKIAFLENVNKKTAKDIFHYAKKVFTDIQPNWQLIRRYSVLNRLIPTILFRLLKKINN